MADAQPEPVNKIGFVVNLADHTVTFSGYVARIDDIDAAHISFSGEKRLSNGSVRTGTVIVTGHIDRVANVVSATTKTTAAAFTYDLLCKPVSSLFGSGPGR
jgi:riboflavin synthase alpha subunit